MTAPTPVSGLGAGAVPQAGSSARALSAEAAKQRVRTLETENRRLMSSHGQLVAESNRRIEVHLNEIRLLKEEVRGLRAHNQQLQDLCGFLDEDRQKTRQLSREWQKFGRYTSELMKQEVTAYQHRIQEQQVRHQQLLQENEELKRLCLYLDEQRQGVIAQATAMAEEVNGTNLYFHNDADSSDAGCGSSARSSSGSERDYKMSPVAPADTHNAVEFDHEREKALRAISRQLQNGTEPAEVQEDEGQLHATELHNDRLFNYIQSLENRIKMLEHQNASGHEVGNNRFSHSSFGSEMSLEEKSAWGDTIEGRPPKLQILSCFTEEDEEVMRTEDDAPAPPAISRQALCNRMIESTTSTMTSSGTTYCSSETDESAATAVFVIGEDETPPHSALEVRTLGPIDEEAENDCESCLETLRETVRERRVPSASSSSGDNADNETEESGIEAGDDMPPKMPLMRDSTARLSLCSSNLSLDNCSNSSSSRASGNRSLPEELVNGSKPRVPPSYNQVQLRHRSSISLPGSGIVRQRSAPHSSLAEAVKSFQTTDEGLLRKLNLNPSHNSWETRPSDTQVTAV